MKLVRERLILALHVLRGRPLCYRMRFHGTVHFGHSPGSIVAECVFRQDQPEGPNGVIQ